MLGRNESLMMGVIKFLRGPPARSDAVTKMAVIFKIEHSYTNNDSD
jgi:hypothetical protein